ncbi:hypothetical protein [Blastococcus sp. KM273128]|uniref:hypothetical protein n=1 Tax=Blastococcus sp. KM273128 TaxID=2570314 RepID=UPI001F34CC79|nr:hypothetical protein [Blastococcus sp. KM273128]
MLPLPALRIEPAVPADHDRIAGLTVRVYVDGGLASAGYAAELADVAGRARVAELLVARDDAGEVVGSVAFVPGGDFGEVLESPDEAGSACSWWTRARRAAAWARRWCAPAWPAPGRPAGGASSSPPAPA